MLKSSKHPIEFIKCCNDIHSLADALAKLERLQPGAVRRPSLLRAQPWRLPSGEMTCFGVMIGPRPSAAPRKIIGLPASARIVATTTTGSHHSFDTAILHNARVDREGNVRLRTGKYLHNVEFRHTAIKDLTLRQREIVELAIWRSTAQDAVIRLVHADIPRSYIDYSLLPKVQLASIAKIEAFVADNTRHASRDEITVALRLAGFQR
jgi:hypothetical protein